MSALTHGDLLSRLLQMVYLQQSVIESLTDQGLVPMASADGIDLKAEIQRFELTLVTRYLALTDGRVLLASQLMRLPSHANLYKRMERLGIARRHYGSSRPKENLNHIMHAQAVGES